MTVSGKVHTRCYDSTSSHGHGVSIFVMLQREMCKQSLETPHILLFWVPLEERKENITHGELYNFPKTSVLSCRYISSLFSCSSCKLPYLYNIITEVKFCFISIMNIAAAVSYSIN